VTKLSVSRTIVTLLTGLASTVGPKVAMGPKVLLVLLLFAGGLGLCEKKRHRHARDEDKDDTGGSPNGWVLLSGTRAAATCSEQLWNLPL
jgi:hypothetical protein